MEKPIIAVDIDDVLSDENLAVLEFINEKYGLSLTAQDYDIDGEYWGYWEKVWQVSDDEGAERFKAYVESGVKRNHRVLPGAVETIQHLKQDFELVIITARGDEQVDLTHEWLEEHFSKTFSDIAFVHQRTGDKKGSKADIAIELGASYLIDDNAGHCELADKANIKALLFGNYGWNRSAAIGPNTQRVRDWAEVKAYFEHERQLQK